MAFEWKEFVEVSRFLGQHAAGAGRSEAFRRSAVGRAYYGAFCHVRTYARDHLNLQPRNDADDHGRLRARLSRGRMRGISDKLERLRQWRNECDYADVLSFDPQTALNLALVDASNIISAVLPPPSSTP
jgi:hypothetical protein